MAMKSSSRGSLSASGDAAPVPPLKLVLRVGTPQGPDDPFEAYLADGRRGRAVIEELLPDDWSFDGRRVLDFGCGAGRTLRQFLPEAAAGELWGCDIDAESIDWLRSHLEPPLHCFRSDATPPLPIDDGYFDLIWAMSVFTHIGDLWSQWLAEMHRILAPNGLLIASFLGPGVFQAVAGEEYIEDRIGMHIRPGRVVFHSEWWLREHWGRAFDILKVRKPGPSSGRSAEVAHRHLLACRRAEPVTPKALEGLDPGEPRERAAEQTNERLLRGEPARALARERKARNRPTMRARRALLRSPLGTWLRALRRRRRPEPN
jgi:SAM-dependent methyltransferase